MSKRVVLAYSGGLDTSVAVRWLIENHGAEVIAVAVDVGQQEDSAGESWERTRQRALDAGAVESTVIDARNEMAEDYCIPAIFANARYEGKYPLVSALSRPVIVKHLVAEAAKHGADTVAHGCTGKGNDQVRFEVGVHSLAPHLDIIAPARVWGMTREESIEYAAKWDIPIGQTKTKIYSIDENLWGRAIECGAMEDPWATPPEEPFTLTKPTNPGSDTMVISFDSGVPSALDGVSKNRRVGIKSREVYECPGALALIAAHSDLEDLCLERDLHHEKARLEPRWAELVYDGMWFSPLKNAIDAFMGSAQKHITGDVRLRFDAPGVMRIEGRRSPVALYDHGLATYDASDTFRHQDAEGFVRLWGLGLQTWATKQGGGQ